MCPNVGRRNSESRGIYFVIIYTASVLLFILLIIFADFTNLTGTGFGLRQR